MHVGLGSLQIETPTLGGWKVSVAKQQRAQVERVEFLHHLLVPAASHVEVEGFLIFPQNLVLQGSAGSRGFRLLSLESRALMSHLTEGTEQTTHRAVGQELARDFRGSLPVDLQMSFMRRPFLMFLDDPAAELPDAD